MSVVVARRAKKPDDLAGRRPVAKLEIELTTDSRDTRADTPPNSTVTAVARA
jgi:hypothetical protein